LDVPDNSNFCKHCGAALTTQGKSGTVAIPHGETPPSGIASVAAAAPVRTGPEQTIWEDYPSFKTVVPGLALWIALILAIFAGYMFLLPDAQHFRAGDGADMGALIIVAAGGVLLVVIILRHFIRLRSIKYRLTNERMFLTHGIFSKRTDEIELEKYKDIFVNQDFWDKMMGCGDIQVVTSDVTNPTVNIMDVVDPIGKKEIIRRCARERQQSLGMTRREEL